MAGVDDFVRMFADEALGRLDRMERELMELEQGSGDEAALVASIFRDAHTIKGGAAMVGLQRLSDLAHGLEDRLDEVRSGKVAVSAELIDMMMSSASELRDLVVGATGSAPAQPVAPAPVTTTAEVSGASAPVASVGDAPVPTSALSSDSISVSSARLDEMIQLVGEAVSSQLRAGNVLEAPPGSEGEEELRSLSLTLAQLQDVIMRARMVPIGSVSHSLHVSVRQVARMSGKSVNLEIRGEDTELDRSVIDQLFPALVHLVRNAVDHGLETTEERRRAGKSEMGTVRIHAMPLGSEVVVAVTDDGRGIDMTRLRRAAASMGMPVEQMSDEDALNLIYRSGLSTAEFVTDVSGRGVGMDAVRSSLDAIRGRIEVRTSAGEGTEFRISVPMTVAVVQCMIVVCGGLRLAIPLHSVGQIIESGTHETQSIDGRLYVRVADRWVGLASLSEVLNLPGDDIGEVLVVSGMTRSFAFQVGRVIGQRDVVIQSFGAALPRIDCIAGSSVETDGGILLVLEPRGIIDRARQWRTSDVGRSAVAATHRGQRILVVDDALTVRELQRAILERAGFEVRTANDGAEALAVLEEVALDLVMTDVEMPNLDGFGLTEAIRADERLANLPVIILTSRANDEDRRRGLEAGADGYITKQTFDERALIAVVERLLGRQR